MLAIALFVYFKNKYSLDSKLLLFIALAFSLWTFFDIILWTNNDSRNIMFFWSLINLVELLVSVLTLYFAYVFLEKKDVSFKFKLIIGGLMSFFVFLIPTKLNIASFLLFNCEAQQGILLNYYRILEAFFSFWIVIYLFRKIKNAINTEERKKTIFLSLGVIFFILSFSGTNIYSSITTQWEILQYGLFGVVVFMSFLAYLIVKFQAFNIKMFGAQALVVGLIILIGSQFFFVRNFTNQILTGITLVLAVVFGWALIRSIKIEVERKNQLQEMSSRLAQANDQLRKLDNAKSEFISIASHQLRTPLTAIKGFISLILEGSYGKISAEIKDVLNKVYLSNERLIELVEDLLNLSRIESGRMEYKFEKINLGEVCQEIYDTFVLRAKEKNLDLDLVLDKNLAMEAVTDRNKIREVISNLVDNGLKYTPKGGVKIKLTEVEEKIQIAIIDTGIGVPEEEIPYLFSKFSRGKDISRLNAGGTGLGLYVGKKMIEALGGRIWVQSAGANMGSTFFIEVPKEQGEGE
ncbi:MAG: hypothetical protein A2271_00465 [Candidatus Moranbacteria bacterium RIFOXYA12_FULL_35_19]|nr:MAG: hypothetical protein A2343_00675 [Candidatus Moranbacteria bacterium RIFOXYB12_FULL_35_8]OGI32745.1 MAG: hypothetical protein A2489_02410 [Candidatus Moranbacteria bacterium RIFOXYC12_FULL_36_13]OGI35190.1 MAG: hypothetical protein A2271_00465 [Candidatus Moranbacteria bacterium RIFOXYA12_FULL_35_19]